MENSIERDIHLLESYAGMTHKMTDNQGRPKLDQAIETVLSELEKKEAIINEMAKQLVEAHGWFYSEFDNFTEKDWIEYFRKKVAEINVGDIPEQN